MTFKTSAVRIFHAKSTPHAKTSNHHGGYGIEVHEIFIIEESSLMLRQQFTLIYYHHMLNARNKFSPTQATNRLP